MPGSRMRLGLCAIAKNEGRFILEWIAHHLSLGFNAITIYDNESDDDTAAKIEAAGRCFDVRRVPWRRRINVSPQLSAYRDFMASGAEAFDWVAFFDIDEFLVVTKKGVKVRRLLNSLPPEITAVGINWLTFGSSSVLRRDYSLVAETFRTGGKRDWGNNRHIKSILRPAAVAMMNIHESTLRHGRYAHPNGQPLTMTRKIGMSDKVDHSLLQLNHYQVKSREDYDLKMARGRVSKRIGDPTRIRPNPDEFFTRLDRNIETYREIDRHLQPAEEIRLVLESEYARTAIARAG